VELGISPDKLWNKSDAGNPQNFLTQTYDYTTKLISLTSLLFKYFDVSLLFLNAPHKLSRLTTWILDMLNLNSTINGL